jgi:hypothetical protein
MPVTGTQEWWAAEGSGYGPTGHCSLRLAKTPVDIQQECAKLPSSPVDRLKEPMPACKTEVLQGTLDLLVLKTLDSMGPMHGLGSPCASSKSPRICCN